MKRLVFLALLASLCVTGIFADLYSPNRRLFTLDTRYFHIIFPDESRSAAHYLATFADTAYDEIGGLLGTRKRYRIPVVFTPDSEILNGSFTQYPYLKILLYQAAIDPNSRLGSFNNDLYKLFYHELTHAVSMTLRGTIQNILVAAFGTPLGLSMYTTPLNFTEGITVSFESRDGFGRATDPLAAAVLRQDIIEGKWKTFTQTMGAYDDFPAKTLYYLYGGYFSKMLQDRYGMEKYAELWHKLGSGLLTRPFEDLGRWTGHFSNVYGLSLDTAWEDLKTAMTIQTPMMMTTDPVRQVGSISAICAGDSCLYYADASGKALLRYDPATKKETKILDANSITKLSASTDGAKLLISTSRVEEGFLRLELRELELADGKQRILPYEKLRDASYVDDGGREFVAVRTNGYQTDIVLVNGTGVLSILEGNERIAYSNPLVFAAENKLYAMARIDGVNSLVRVDMSDGTRIERLETPEGLAWLRYLSQGNGMLYMGWDDDKLYRLVEIEGDAIRWQTMPISGGVHFPVATKDGIFHLSNLSDGNAPSRFPMDRGQLGFAEAKVSWVPAGELGPKASVYDRDGREGEKNYNEAFWLLPRFWHPTLEGNLSEGITSYGISLYMQDPIERLGAQASAGWDAVIGLPTWSASLDINAWETSIRLSASESFNRQNDPYCSGSSLEYRNTRAEAVLRGTKEYFSGSSFSWLLGTGASASSDITGEGFESAYRLWDIVNLNANGALGFAKFRRKTNDPYFSKGFGLQLISRNIYTIVPSAGTPFSTGLELTGFFKATPLELSVYAAYTPFGSMVYSPQGYSISGATQSFGGTASYPSFGGFSSGKPGDWYSQAEAKLRIIHAPIQGGMGIAYFNRLCLEAGARGAIASPGTWHAGASTLDFLATVYGRLSLTWTGAYGMAAQIHPQSWVEIWINPETMKYGLDFSVISGY